MPSVRYSSRISTSVDSRSRLSSTPSGSSINTTRGPVTIARPYCHALLLSATELSRRFVGMLPEPERLQHFIHARVFLSPSMSLHCDGPAGRAPDRLFHPPDTTILYPAHDYKGWTVSSIGEEKRFNPRLAGKTEDMYVEITNNLHLPHPAMMDVAIPANLACGQL